MKHSLPYIIGPGAVLAWCLALEAVAANAQDAPGTPPPDHYQVHEATIADLQAAMASGRVTAVELVDAYTARIRAYDQTGPRLNAVLSLNVNAREEAAALDAERARRGPRGPLHGIPVLLKDNIDAADMPTTGASFALARNIPPDDAYLVRRLREAGAVILGKTNLHELAVGITTVSSLDGQTLNPYDPERNPGGSSGGTGAAVAASFAAIGYGTDTCGSIRIPAAFNALFGLRPTKGLVSMDGMIPLSHTQDVAGPLARTVTDLAIGLDAITGHDPADPATSILEGREPPRFLDALDPGALKGARIGLLSAYLTPLLFRDDLQDLLDAPRQLGGGDREGLLFALAGAEEMRETGLLTRSALDRMRTLGAEVIEVALPGVEELLAGSSTIDHEFKFDLMDYLAERPAAQVDSLGDILARGLFHTSIESLLRRRNQPLSRDTEAYRRALALRAELQDSLRALFERERLDAIAYPTMRREAARIGERQRGSTCGLSATSGYPAITMPAGFTLHGMPIGIELLGRPLEDAKLVALAYAYEQVVRPRRPPPSTPPLTEY